MSRGILAAGSALVSEMVATLPSHLQRPFRQAKALYRFLANPRVGAEALLERVCRESALALQGQEVLVFLDLSPVRKPHARALEGIARVGRKREAGYELLTALGMDAQGRLALKKCFRHPQVRVEVLSAPRELSEIQAALEPGPLVEGWRVYGKVVLEDGRFRRFYWTPRYSQEGEPLPEEVRLVFPEGEEVRFRLHHKAFGLRFGVARWRLGERLPYRTLGFDQERYPLRFYLASGGGFVTSPEDLKPDLEALHGEGPYKDELIVEVRVDGHSDGWRRLAILPVEVEPGMEIWVSEEGLHVRTDPLGLPVRLRVWAGEAFIGETLAKGDGGLAVPKALVPLKVEVSLGNELRTWEMAPKGWPMRWWRLGLGF